jgi:predicted metal-dependent hydrolase
MANSYIKNIEEIPVLFEKSNRAKNIGIRIKHNGDVRVAVPRFSTYKYAEQIARDRIEWIRVKREHMKVHKEQLKEKLKDIKPIDTDKAKVILINRLEELSEIYGFNYNRVFIRNQKTRWGSCSGKNNISLNINLVRVSNELQDYVILHELVHTKIKNHSLRFWKELDKYVRDAKHYDRLLKKEGYILMGKYI